MSTAAPDAAPGSTQHAAPNAAGPHQDPHPVRTFVTTALVRMFPPITWVPKYKPAESLLKDVAGGVVMGVMFIPMGLGYASLLNIPLQVGLWSACIYSGLYAFFGNTGVLSMGPVAEITLMLMGTSGLGDDPETRASTIQVISFEVGILSLGLCLVMGGTIIRNSFARAVGNAYAAAAGIILIVVQMKDALNIKGTSTVLLHEAIQVIITGLQNTNGYNTAYCFIMFLLMFMYLQTVKHFKQIPSWVPHQLFVVVVAILVTWLARLDQQINLNIVKTVKSDWPLAQAPDTSKMSSTIVSGVVITLVSFLQMYSIATRFSDDVHANQELFANGICAFVAGFLGMIPGSSSFSRSAVLTDIGAKSPLNSLVSALVVFVSVVGLTRAGVFYYLPKVALAAIIVAGVLKLVDFTHAKWLFKFFKIDFCVWLTVFLLTLFMGVTYGILGGIALSILIVLFSVGIPKSTTLGYNAAGDRWYPVRRDEELLLHREVHVWSFDSPLYFINVSYFTPQLESSMKQEGRPIRVIVVNCSGISSIDASSVEGFAVQARNLETRRKVVLLFAALSKEVREALHQCPEIGFPHPHFDTINDAVAHADALIAKEKNLLAPHRPVPAALYKRAGVASLAARAVGICTVVANADRSPKQKLKLPLAGSALAEVLHTSESERCVELIVDPSDYFYVTVREMLVNWPEEDVFRRAIAKALAGLMESHSDDLHVSVRRQKSHATGDLLVAKWGGVLTAIGTQQAVACGEAVAHRLGFTTREPQRTVFGELQSVPPTVRPRVTAITNGEVRVTHTGVAFVKGFTSSAEVGPVSHLLIDQSLDSVTPQGKEFSEKCLEVIDSALHAATPRQRELHLHVPGLRRVMETLAAADHTERRRVPRLALEEVASLTANLIDAVRSVIRQHLHPSVSTHQGEDGVGGVDEESSPAPKRPLAMAAGAAPDTPPQPPRRTASQLHRSSREPLYFADGEQYEDLVRRYTLVLATFVGASNVDIEADQDSDDAEAAGHHHEHGTPHLRHHSRKKDTREVFAPLIAQAHFDVGKITALYDNATYDVIHNASELERRCGYDMRPLVALLQPLYVAVTSGRFGVTSSERLVGGALHGIALLQRLRQTLLRMATGAADVPTPPNSDSDDEGQTAAATSSRHDKTAIPVRDVPIDMIFTSASLITALRNCMAFSSVMRTSANAHAQAALLQEETGWHYMAHAVLILTKSKPRGTATGGGRDASTTAASVQPARSDPFEVVQSAAAEETFDNASFSSPPATEQDIMGPFVLDVYLSTGASLRSEAAKGLLHNVATKAHLVDAPVADASTTEVMPAANEPFASRLGALDEAETSGASEGDDPATEGAAVDVPAAARFALHDRLRIRQAARQLKKVTPMARVWRVPLLDFARIVDEMTHLVELWTDEKSPPLPAAAGGGGDV